MVLSISSAPVLCCDWSTGQARCDPFLPVAKL